MKMATLRLHHYFAFVTFLILPTSLSAQYEYRTYSMPSGMGGMFNNSISATISANMWNRIFTCSTSKTCGSTANGNTTSGNSPSGNTRSQPSPATAKPLDTSALRFRGTASYIKTRELADQLGSNQAERDQYFKLMNAVLDSFGQKVAAAGLKNDIAIAISYFFLENLRIYRGEPEPSDEQFVAIRNMIADVIAAQDSLRNVPDRQKQEMYEALVAYTGITQFGYEQAKQAGNAEMMKGYQQAAQQNLQALTKIPSENLR